MGRGELEITKVQIGVKLEKISEGERRNLELADFELLHLPSA
jgi:hypothetical protein